MANHDMGSMKPAASPRMDHSRMSMPASRAANADHSAMPGMTRAAGTNTPMRHDAAAQQGGADEATEKMRALVRALLSDPAVLRQIERNDSLRRAWQNPAVQKTIKGN